MPQRRFDADSQAWWERLHGEEPTRSSADAELHERLRREAAFHIRDRARNRAEVLRGDIDDLAMEAADGALTVLLRKLDDYRGESQFWTWARRFAALEALASIRRRIGHDRIGISRDPELVLDVPDPAHSAQELLESRELLQRVNEVIETQLTDRQRTVLIAVAVNGLSAAALADELHATRGAIYKSLHDARVKVRLGVSEPLTGSRGP
jgi:RNA polymerase sigma-70 factor (ECF subfamily)